MSGKDDKKLFKNFKQREATKERSFA